MSTFINTLQPYAGRHVLVTGHTGFKGSWLCLALHRLGARVTGIALEPPSTPNLFTLAAVREVVEDQRVDLCDYEAIAATISAVEPEIVFHLAAQPIVRRAYAEPKETFDVNVGGTVNVLEAIRICPSVRAAVMVTTDKCYENKEWLHAYRETDPLGGYDPYSASKAAAEMVCAAYARSFFASNGVALATARAGNVIGGGDWAQDRIVPDMVRSLENGEPVGVRNPSAIRPWQHVLEPLSGYLRLGAYLLEAAPGFSGAWNFGPAPTSFRPVADLVKTYIEQHGTGQWLDLSKQQGDAPHEASILTLAWEKAFHTLAWQPRWDFAETMARTAAWYKRQAAGEAARTLCFEDLDAYFEDEAE